MSQLKVILDPSLVPNDYISKMKKFNDKTFGTFDPNKFDLTIRYLEHNENLIKDQTSNGFLNAFLLAYNTHTPLKIGPEDFHIMIGMV
ncbi:MAG: hypothetical protein EBQ92_13625, partial [Proteobacteria bacterium]|nr:hypothetical protein [Pseudomonadota bacterium]